MKLSLVMLATAATTVLAAPRPWCLRPGQPCWKLKRAVDALGEHASTPSPVDDAVPAVGADNIGLFASGAHDRLVHLASQSSFDPADAAEFEKRWCMQNRKCWKRNADEHGELAKRWCLRPGEPCWKAKRAAESVLNAGQEEGDAQEQDCGDDGECSVAKRHLDGLHHVARAIVEAF
ncbi:mating pheromone precursor [Beauveria brongniartii RCEF 3172]|uniref:Mating pheromone n=1 Tax=Beauveria brongniartii RCEF 3172 TaxID=1081107 RepID=A0A162K3J1_9HYPO|nr:mating pheromone precursor [Beauveria brongniartii RCEF 3172]